MGFSFVMISVCMGKLYGGKMRLRRVAREKRLTAKFAKNSPKDAQKKNLK